MLNAIFGGCLGASWGRLGASWGRLGVVLGRLGASWEPLDRRSPMFSLREASEVLISMFFLGGASEPRSGVARFALL